MGAESGKQPLGVCLFFAAFAAFCRMSGLFLDWGCAVLDAFTGRQWRDFREEGFLTEGSEGSEEGTGRGAGERRKKEERIAEF
jgi:hypothetical protein